MSGSALHPADTATTLRIRGDARDVQDGPYAASKEQFGGYYITEAPDPDTALHWAALTADPALRAFLARRRAEVERAAPPPD